MEELIGRTLDRYRIIQLLGKGGMGAVFRAHDPTLDQVVALKVMNPGIAYQPHFQQRFITEARAAASLDHPGVIKVLNMGDYNDPQFGKQLFIVMEFIRGGTLRQLLEHSKRQRKWIPMNQAVTLIQEVGFALFYMHEQGVLHRDLKPDNIMLKPSTNRARAGVDYQPVITDLGLAKLQDGNVTRTGTSVGGTPAYMSPEQVQGEKLDARSDVYSLGVLLYEMTVGQRPFPSKKPTEAFYHHVHTPPRPPRSICANLPAELESIILRCLQKNPNERFSSAEIMAAALGSLHLSQTQAVLPQGATNGLTSVEQLYQNSLTPISAQPTPSPLPEQHIPSPVPIYAARTEAMPNGVSTSENGQNNNQTSSQKGLWLVTGLSILIALFAVVLNFRNNLPFFDNAGGLPTVPEENVPEENVQEEQDGIVAIASTATPETSSPETPATKSSVLATATTEESLIASTWTPLPTDTMAAPPTPTNTPTVEPTLPPLPTATSTAVSTATALPTHTATPLPTATPTSTPTSVDTATMTPIPVPTSTSTSTPTGTATFTPTPTEVPTHPGISAESFLRNYYQLANTGNYAVAWPQVSDHFKTTRNDTFPSFSAWWDSIRIAEILSLGVRSDDGSTASIETTIRYTFQDGRTSSRILLFDIRKQNSGQWQIYDIIPLD